MDLAVEQDKLETILKDVESFNQVCENQDFKLMLKSPIVNSGKKQQIFNKLFAGKYNEMTMAFLSILLRKGREPLLEEIGREFVAQYKRYSHISSVKLTTAHQLSKENIDAIRQKLVKSTTTDDKIELETVVDPALIGGFVVEFEDRLYDASVAHKMALLKKEFKDNLYISQIIAS